MSFVPMQVEQLTDLQGVQADLVQLWQLLEQEFEALKNRDLKLIAELEDLKTDLLTRLDGRAEQFRRADQIGTEWMQARDDLVVCRDLHFKNLQLLRRQLDIVQGTLQVMVGDFEPLPALYDRLGNMGQQRSARAWQAA